MAVFDSAGRGVRPTKWSASCTLAALKLGGTCTHACTFAVPARIRSSDGHPTTCGDVQWPPLMLFHERDATLWVQGVYIRLFVVRIAINPSRTNALLSNTCRTHPAIQEALSARFATDPSEVTMPSVSTFGRRQYTIDLFIVSHASDPMLVSMI